MPDTNPDTVSPQDVTAIEPATSTDTFAPDSAVVDGTNSETASPETAPESGEAEQEEPTEENTAPDAPASEPQSVDVGDAPAADAQAGVDVGDAPAAEPSASDTGTASIDLGEDAPAASASEEAASDDEGKSDETAPASAEEDGATSENTPASESEPEPADNADAPVLESDAGDAPVVQGAPAIPQASAYQADSDKGDGSKIETDPNAGPGPIDPSKSGGDLGNVPANVPNVPVTEDINGDGKDTNPLISDGTEAGDSANTVTEDSGTEDDDSSDEDSDDSDDSDDNDEDDFAPNFGGADDKSDDDSDEAAGIDDSDECIFGEPKQLVANIVDILEDDAMEAYKQSGEQSVKALRMLGAIPMDTLGAADKELLGNMQAALQEHVKHVLAFFHMDA